ncbi:MAG: DUF507 family protein [Myxococcota bacterium]
MRLYNGKVPAMAEDIVRSLARDGDIEVENEPELRLDLEAVMKEFIRRDRQVLEEAKTRMEQRGLSYSVLGKMKAQVAKERAFPPNDEQLPYIVGQLLEMLFHSNNVAEIFADDPVLRKKITHVVREHSDLESELDKEVRSKIKNLQEGTQSFEVEYAKVLQ